MWRHYCRCVVVFSCYTAINQQQQYGGTAASAITLSTESEEESDDEPPPRIVKLRPGLSRNTPAAQPEAKRQRKQPNYLSVESGGYQDLATQRRLAAEERQAYTHLLEVRTDQHGGRGLFAKRDLNKGDIQLSYFGKHYPGESHFLHDYPNDDAAYGMEINDEFYDGIKVDGLMRYTNHNKEGKNSVFVDQADTPYVQLELTKRVGAGHEILVDYGKDYNYEAHNFARE